MKGQVMGLLSLAVATGLAALCVAPSLARAPDTLEQAAISQLFKGPGVTGTRAVVMLQDGKLVGEQYAPGFSANNRFISWSMAKSVTSTMVGILADQGKLQLDAPAPVAAWQKPGDRRAAITLRQMLHMSSGIQHQEGAEPSSPVEKADTVQMLFGKQAGDFAMHALARPLESAPGSVYEYSTANSTLLSYIAGNAITRETHPQKRRAIIAAWLKTNLFDPAGMPSAVAEFDAAGNFLGGSLVHATARDWANFGQTYLNNGVGPEGKRVVSEAWVRFVQMPAATDAGYGGHFWLNRIRTSKDGPKFPALFPGNGPENIYGAVGHLGQYVVIVPDQKLVVVRIGKTPDEQLGPVRASLGQAVNILSKLSPTLARK
jgi:CubicO group peptidase (beta-lactamase class C family)